MTPRLIHPVTCELANVDTGASYDADFDEPVGETTYSAPFTIQAQVQMNRGEELEGVATGIQKRGEGYLLAKRADAALVNQRAKLTKMGTVECEYYVFEKRPAVHYTDSNMMLLLFETKEAGT